VNTAAPADSGAPARRAIPCMMMMMMMKVVVTENRDAQ
jgi:hypothetical protein